MLAFQAAKVTQSVAETVADNEMPAQVLEAATNAAETVLKPVVAGGKAAWSALREAWNDAKRSSDT